MKIGILTHHYVKNYGAFLQMKGMYETLQRLYPEAEVTVINYVKALEKKYSPYSSLSSGN